MNDPVVCINYISSRVHPLQNSDISCTSKLDSTLYISYMYLA